MAPATLQQEKLSKTLSGIAGEYFVAAELSRRGFIAAVTLRNTRGIDILASRPGRKTSATIQVKTLQNGRIKWPLKDIDEKAKGPNHYYVFVTLNGTNGGPEYHVVEGNYVARQCRANDRKWHKGRKKDGSKRKVTKLRVFRPGKDFRDGWDRICLD